MMLGTNTVSSFRDCVFTSNFVNSGGQYTQGGAVVASGQSTSFSNCLFVRNSISTCAV